MEFVKKRLSKREYYHIISKTENQFIMQHAPDALRAYWLELLNPKIKQPNNYLQSFLKQRKENGFIDNFAIRPNDSKIEIEIEVSGYLFLNKIIL